MVIDRSTKVLVTLPRVQNSAIEEAYGLDDVGIGNKQATFTTLCNC